MIGLDRHTGRAISGDAHLAQSIGDILSTPKGSLVLERRYGSDVPDLVDLPINGATLVDIYQAAAEALDLWEPRARLTRVEVTDARPGAVDLRLTVDGPNGPRAIETSVGDDAGRAATARAIGGAA